MQVKHGALIIDVPDGWADRSTLLFVAHADDDTRAGNESISVSFAPCPDRDLEKILRLQLERLRQLDPELDLVDETRFASAVGVGRLLALRLLLGGRVLRQYIFVAPVEDQALIVAAACNEAAFSFTRDRFVSTLASLRLEKPAAPGRRVTPAGPA